VAKIPVKKLIAAIARHRQWKTLRHSAQVEFVDRIRRVVLAVGHPTLDGVDGQEPAQRCHIRAHPHLDAGRRTLVFIQFSMRTY